MAENNNKIPTPPPPPETAEPGYNSDGYWDLINSLSYNYEEKLGTLNELEKPEVIRHAAKLKEELAKNVLICNQLDNTRERFLAALLLLQRNEISKSQLATLHIVDSAIRTLYTNPMSYLIYTFEQGGISKKSAYTYILPQQDLPTSISRFMFDVTLVPDAKTGLSALPYKMQQPVIKRFFNFTNDEWNNFAEEMKNVPASEKGFHVLSAPEFGCWSSLIFKIQDVLDCMHVLDCMKSTDSGYLEEKIMVVPSFSMFQAALNVKAKSLNRKPLELVPTYYYLNENDYCKYKAVGRIPMTLYMPEYEQWLQYKNDAGRFRTTVDGHPSETAFAGAIHDEYHAFRELQMTENIAAARVRLATIAKHHPDNYVNGRFISSTLMDGELLYSYPMSKNTLFKPNHRPQQQVFGDIFSCGSLSGKLTDRLKRAFIADMVEHADEWKENFNLGRYDLLPADAKIYDEIRNELAAAATYSRRPAA